MNCAAELTSGGFVIYCDCRKNVPVDMNWMTSIISILDQQVSALRHGAGMKGNVSLAVFIIHLYPHTSITPNQHGSPDKFVCQHNNKRLRKCSACSRRIRKKLSERCVRFILGNRQMRRHTVAASHHTGCRTYILATLCFTAKDIRKTSV